MRVSESVWVRKFNTHTHARLSCSLHATLAKNDPHVCITYFFLQVHEDVIILSPYDSRLGKHLRASMYVCLSAYHINVCPAFPFPLSLGSVIRGNGAFFVRFCNSPSPYTIVLMYFSLIVK